MFKSRFNEEKVQEIILSVFNQNGSDLHFSPYNHIGYRVNRKLIKYKEADKLTPADTKAIYNAISNMLEPEYKELIERHMIEKKHAGFSLSIQDKRLRVNVSKARNGFYIVLRMLENKPKDLSELGFSDKIIKSLKEISKKESGLFLVVGPSDSGKSTTLASLINEINKNEQKNIITLEDPIEYIYEEINSNIVQKEIGPDIISFYEGLHSALREDPNVILVEEIRDERTLNLALKAAETGRLVLSALYTNDVSSSIQKIITMTNNHNLTKNRLVNVLTGILAQKLEFVSLNSEKEQKRLLLYEMGYFDNKLKEFIKKDNEMQIKTALDISDNSQSYEETLSQYVFDKKIEPLEAERLAINKNELKNKLKNKGY